MSFSWAESSRPTGVLQLHAVPHPWPEPPRLFRRAPGL